MEKTLREKFEEIMLTLAKGSNFNYDAYIVKDEVWNFGYIILTDIVVPTIKRKIVDNIALVESKTEDMLIFIQFNQYNSIDCSYKYIPNGKNGNGCSYKDEPRTITNTADLITYAKVDRAFADQLKVEDKYLLTTKENIVNYLNKDLTKLEKIN